MPGSVKVGGAWKTVAGASVKVGGAWKTVSAAYTKVGGVWKQWLSASAPYYIATTTQMSVPYDLAIDTANNVYVAGINASYGQLMKLSANLSSFSGYYINQYIYYNSTYTVTTDGTYVYTGGMYGTSSSWSGKRKRWNSSLSSDQDSITYGTPALFTWYASEADSSGNTYFFGKVNTNQAAFASFNSSGGLTGSFYMGDGFGGQQEIIKYNRNAAGEAAYSWYNYSWTTSVFGKLNADNTLAWSKRSTPDGNPYNYGSGIDASGNVYLLQAGASRLYLMKANAADGAAAWQKYISGAFTRINETTNQLAIDSASNIYIASADNGQIKIFKFNSSGTLQWQRSLSSSAGGLEVAKIKIDAAGALVILGKRTNAQIYRLPADGSLTGTHVVGSETFTYAASSYTVTTSSWTLPSAGYKSAVSLSNSNSSSPLTAISGSPASKILG